MLTRAMIEQARRVAHRCRPHMTGARARAWARAWARADRDTFGQSKPPGLSGTASADEAGRNDGGRRFWWEDREG